MQIKIEYKQKSSYINLKLHFHIYSLGGQYYIMATLYLAKKFMDGLHKLYGINQGFGKVFEFPSENMTNSFPFYRQTANSTLNI